jgi:hypothetical protein
VARGTTREHQSLLGLITLFSSLVFDTVATPLHQLGNTTDGVSRHPKSQHPQAVTTPAFAGYRRCGREWGVSSHQHGAEREQRRQSYRPRGVSYSIALTAPPTVQEVRRRLETELGGVEGLEVEHGMLTNLSVRARLHARRASADPAPAPPRDGSPKYPRRATQVRMLQ